ncbi:MAG: 3-ketoacyl-ACP reductase [Planctomycetales bacterium]|nr:3-ketoacyl-ACP reductase [Planctomycetales bacterium]
MSDLSRQSSAIVTGSSRGIGRAVAQHLAAAGHAVVVNYLRNADAAREVVDAIHDAGGQATAVAADVADRDGRERLVQSAQQMAPLRVLVNNAGITSVGRRDLLEATEESWEAVFSTNLKGPFFLAQLAARQMLENQPVADGDAGRIINITSISAYAVSTNRADYCMAKSAMRTMTLLFADRLADEGIRVYEVCPGVISSDMTAPVRDKYDRLIAEGLTPIRRWGQPEDVGRAVVALAGDAFPFSTGDCINVDGGFHIRRL